MIKYNAGSWLDTLFRWEGTVLRRCWKKVAAFFVFISAAYVAEVYLDFNFGKAFKHSQLIGQALSFLLVFRANNSYGRYWEGRKCCAEFFSHLRDMGMLGCTLLKGGRGQHEWNRFRGEDGFTAERTQGVRDLDDHYTSAARTEIVRWILALAVAFRINTRLNGAGYFDGAIDEETKWKLNWERMRLRTLMSQGEFQELDKMLQVEDTPDEWKLLWGSGRGEPQIFHQEPPPGHPEGVYAVSKEPSCRQVLAMLNYLMQSLRFIGNEPYAFKERFVPIFVTMMTQIIRLQNRVIQTMTTPLPLPFVHLVRTLLLLYLFSTPFFIDRADGIWANVVMQTVTALALFGIDQMGTELENPFGSDANDIDIQEMIVALERELMRLLEYAGDTAARHSFTWLPVPAMMQAETPRPFLWYLALRREVSHLEVPRCRGVGGVRIRHVVAPPPAKLTLAVR